ncbi:hemerythrin domain-containing protein [Tardiphaga sp.]|uniref:hemerythrin domain-containing protein n=1 Tax=Tardiphaga sp. TaxID=1926292 RepID=UPI00352AA6E0
MPGKAHDDIQRGHAKVRAAAEQLLALLDTRQLADMTELARARWSFASELIQSLTFKERYLYGHFERNSTPAIKDKFAASIAAMEQCFVAYRDHMQRWPTEITATSWPDYTRSAQTVVRAFLARIDHEERHLLPIAREMGALTVSSATPARNWARQAFDIKGRIGL